MIMKIYLLIVCKITHKHLLKMLPITMALSPRGVYFIILCQPSYQINEKENL